MNGLLKRALRRPHALVSMFLIDPLELLSKWRGLGAYARNARAYSRSNRNESFDIRWGDLWYRSYDRYADAGSITFHYFFQDLWAASHLHEAGVRRHVDVGSRLDGFVAHALTFCDVCYVDVRPLGVRIPRLTFTRALVTELPFATGSIPSLSCLHVLEHVGLGRYGDPIDPEGHIRAAAELARVLEPGGTLLFGTPVGRERVCFDAHRVFDPDTVVRLFSDLRLAEFSLIDDRGRWRSEGASFADAQACSYGCGLFRFEKPCRS
jgi:SAM-dependent methyltransferase